MKASLLNTRSLKEDPFHAIVYGGQVATIKALCFYYGYPTVLTPFIQNTSSTQIILKISEKFTWTPPLPTLQYYVVIVLNVHKSADQVLSLSKAVSPVPGVLVSVPRHSRGK